MHLKGTALVKTHFPDWSYDSATYYLACLLHDIGTADAFLASTKMSFEFKGAIVARELLLSSGSSNEDQADGICEAIIRHQDLFVKGFVFFILAVFHSLACFSLALNPDELHSFQWEYYDDRTDPSARYCPWYAPLRLSSIDR